MLKLTAYVSLVLSIAVTSYSIAETLEQDGAKNTVEIAESCDVLIIQEEFPQDRFFVVRRDVSVLKSRKVFIRAIDGNASDLAVDDFCYVDFPSLKIKKAEVPLISKQYGGVRHDFDVAGNRGFIIMSEKQAHSKDVLASPGAYGISVISTEEDGVRPWIWFAPVFLPEFPDDINYDWLFRHFLDNGFAICGVDVGRNTFGNKKARVIHTAFYEYVVSKYKLSSKACLLAQSQGGLSHYNWAVENPESVQCIGGIYPVCNLESWPAISGACGAYGMTEGELRMSLKNHNPIERLVPLATEKIPILHLHGDIDTVVPLKENSAELARRYSKLGGEIEIITIEGKGHDGLAKEFFQSQTLLDFFNQHGIKDGAEKE